MKNVGSVDQVKRWSATEWQSARNRAQGVARFIANADRVEFRCREAVTRPDVRYGGGPRANELCNGRGHLLYATGLIAGVLFPGSSAVEQPAVNRLVAGSNPARGANKIKGLFAIGRSAVFIVRSHRD